MKQKEISQAVRVYRAAIDEWNSLMRDLESAAEAASMGSRVYPLLGRSAKVLQNAHERLEQVGNALGWLPGLADALRDEMRIAAMLRQFAEQHGLTPRYDLVEAEGE